MQRAMFWLIPMHLFCLASLLLSKCKNAFNKKRSYSHNFLMVLSVFLYQFAIFKTYFEVTQQQKIVNEN